MRQTSYIFKWTILLLLIPLLSLVLIVSTSSSAQVIPDWITKEPIYHVTQQDKAIPKECKDETWTIQKIAKREYRDADGKLDVCVFYGDGFAYAYYSREYKFTNWAWLDAVQETGMVVAFGDAISAKRFTQVDVGWSRDSPRLKSTPARKEVLMIGAASSGFGNNYYLFNDFSKAFTFDPVYSLYRLSIQPDYIRDNHGQIITAYGYGQSLNGKWLAFVHGQRGVILYDLDDGTSSLVDARQYSLSNAWPGQSFGVSVSNTGRYITIGGLNTPFIVITQDKECAIVDYYQDRPVQHSPTCLIRDITQLADKNSMPRYGAMGGLRVYSDITIRADGSSVNYYDGYKWATIYASNSRPPEDSLYLALGDSYASGEGDINVYGSSGYFTATNVLGDYPSGIAREMCHLSPRSYPFLLGSQAGLQRRLGMDSVACSGAMRINIAKLSSDQSMHNEYEDGRYFGQNTERDGANRPRLAGLANAASLQQDALDAVLPGRVQQIEQLKLLQPEVATIQISGNDLKFGPIITACVANLAGRIGLQYTDCDWSKPEFRANIASAILSNRTELVKLYKELHSASPNTQLYAVGYPLFIKQVVVCTRLATLSTAELEFLAQSIHFANQTIRSAASEAGIRYIDIEDALGDETICGKSGAMTDPIDLLSGAIMADKKRGATADQVIAKYNIINPLEIQYVKMLYIDLPRAEEALKLLQSPYLNYLGVIQQLFHPNAEGHRLIASKITKALGNDTILTAHCDGNVIICPSVSNSAIPSVPAYFGSALSVKGTIVEMSSITLDTVMDPGGIALGVSRQVGDIVAVARGSMINIKLTPQIAILPEPLAVLHSDSYSLGTLSQNSNGMYSATVMVPNEIEPGIHILEISGKTTDGRLYKAFETVAVIGSQDNEDGDGVRDAVDTCLYSLSCTNPSAVTDQLPAGGVQTDVSHSYLPLGTPQSGVHLVDSIGEAYAHEGIAVKHNSSSDRAPDLVVREDYASKRGQTVSVARNDNVTYLLLGLLLSTLAALVKTGAYVKKKRGSNTV